MSVSGRSADAAIDATPLLDPSPPQALSASTDNDSTTPPICRIARRDPEPRPCVFAFIVVPFPFDLFKSIRTANQSGAVNPDCPHLFIELLYRNDSRGSQSSVRMKNAAVNRRLREIVWSFVKRLCCGAESREGRGREEGIESRELIRCRIKALIVGG
nr:hypothetical protein [Burkholderia perseverans]